MMYNIIITYASEFDVDHHKAKINYTSLLDMQLKIIDGAHGTHRTCLGIHLSSKPTLEQAHKLSEEWNDRKHERVSCLVCSERW